MKIGIMNNPLLNIYDEIEWIGKNKFDFVELTIEKPNAYGFNTKRVVKLLRHYNLDIIGHTSSLLQICSLFERVRKTAVAELKFAMRILHNCGAKKMTIHLDTSAEGCSDEDRININKASLRELLLTAKKIDMQILVEHFDKIFSRPATIDTILRELPQIGLTLDLGHANLFSRKCLIKNFISKFKGRISHVHISDNKGGFYPQDDKHLPLGKGNINWREVIPYLRRYYNGAITLEVFGKKMDLLRSRKYLLQLLNKGNV